MRHSYPRPEYVPEHARYRSTNATDPDPSFWPRLILTLFTLGFLIAAFALGIWAIVDGQQPPGPAEFVTPPAPYNPPAVR